MKDEIKEILDELKAIVESKDDENGLVYIEHSYLKAIYYHITNLQEKYDIAQKDVEAMKHNYNLLVRLIENGESVTQKFENGLTYQDYKSRIDKAVEYIKWNLEANEELIEYFNYDANFNKLLNILTGGDE